MQPPPAEAPGDARTPSSAFRVGGVPEIVGYPYHHHHQHHQANQHQQLLHHTAPPSPTATHHQHLHFEKDLPTAAGDHTYQPYQQLGRRPSCEFSAYAHVLNTHVRPKHLLITPAPVPLPSLSKPTPEPRRGPPRRCRLLSRPLLPIASSTYLGDGFESSLLTLLSLFISHKGPVNVGPASILVRISYISQANLVFLRGGVRCSGQQRQFPAPAVPVE